MSTPVNNGTPGVLNLDYKIVHATMLDVASKAVDLTADVSSEFVADLNRQDTSTQVVNLEGSIELQSVPADRSGALPYTEVIGGGPVEVKLTEDEYAKPQVDRLGVKPVEAAQRLGRMLGKAVLLKRNSHLLSTLAANGTAIELVTEFADLTGAETWAALNESNTQFAEAEVDTTSTVTYVAPRPWGKVQDDIASLRTGVSAQEQAKSLLQLGTFRVINLPADIVAIQFHGSAVVAPAVLDRLRLIEGDADDAVFTRVKFGSKVLLPGAVRVIKAAPAA